MTENNEVQPEISSTDESSSDVTPVSSGAESMVSQDKVNALIKATKEKVRTQAYKKGYDDAMTQNSADPTSTAPVAPDASAPTNNTGMPDVESLVENQVNARLQNLMQAQQQQALHQHQLRVQQEMSQKLASSTDSLPDLAEKITQSGLDNIPDVFIYANEVPNSAEVVHALASSPEKLGTFLNFSRGQGTANAAMNYIKQLSDNIGNNQAAKSQAKNLQNSTPLSSIQSSPVSSAGKEGNSIQDYKTYYKNRF